jgi:hypothetical protein
VVVGLQSGGAVTCVCVCVLGCRAVRATDIVKMLVVRSGTLLKLTLISRRI